MKVKNVKNIVSKVSFFTLCAFSLPFLVHNSSFESPRIENTVREMRSESGYSELNGIVEKIMKRNLVAGASPFPITLGFETPLSKTIAEFFHDCLGEVTLKDQKGWVAKDLIKEEAFLKAWEAALSQVSTVVQPFLNSW